MAQRLINIRYVFSFRTLFATLALLFVCPGVWGDDINVNNTNKFGALTDGKYTLVHGNTYTLTEHVTTEGYIYVPSDATVTINLGIYNIDRGLNSAVANGFVIKNEGTLTITSTNQSRIFGGKNDGNGGGIYNTGTLTIEGTDEANEKVVYIVSNSATGNGGGIFNTGTGTVSLSNTVIDNNSATYGGGIYNEGTLNLSSGRINSNTAVTQGGGIYHRTGTLNISNKQEIKTNNVSPNITNNVYLCSGQKIAVNGNLSNTTFVGVTMEYVTGEFTTGLGSYTGDYQNFKSDDARFVSANSSGNAKLQTYWMDLQEQLDAGNVTLTRNYEYIAGIDNSYLTVNADRTLNLGNHKIDRKLTSAITDGYVIKVTGGTLTVTGTGQITGGNNNGDGGGIHIASGGTLLLSGGNITGNTAATGGGIYNGGTLNTSGAPIVTGNTGGNVYLPNGKVVNITEALTSSTNIGVTMENPGTITSGLITYASGHYEYFTSDDNTYEVGLSANEATLTTPWNALKSAFAAGGNITLTKSYTAPAGEFLTVGNSKTVTLDLNGWTIDRGLTNSAAVSDGYVILVESGSELTIKDNSSGGNGTITGGNNTGDGGGIYNNGTLNIQGGRITGNKVADGQNGGAIYNNGTLTMQGAPYITGNTANGTANNIYLPAAHPTITISAALSNTTAIGITMETRGVFTSGLNSTTGYQNFASDNTTFETGNNGGEAQIQTEWEGLQTLLSAGGTVTLSKNYTAKAIDAGLVISSVTVTLILNGKTINRNLASAAENGYVIKVNEGATLTIQGSNGTIKGGYNSGNGGGIHNCGTLTISTGTISDNHAANGAGVYNETTGRLTISGGTFYGNIAATNGGAVYHNGIAFAMQGAPTIKTNYQGTSTLNNIYLPSGKIINISEALTNNTTNYKIGITTAYTGVFTSNLNGRGNAANFSADDSNKGIALNASYEAIIGTSYNITSSCSGGTLSIKNSAIEGERISVTITASSGYVPYSLTCSTVTLSPDATYPKNGTYTFTMPASDVAVNAVCLKGGYCGATENEDIKWVLNGTTLNFIAKDASSYQMANYTQNNVPWRSTSTYPYTSVGIPSNITNISDYAFYGSNLESITIPSTISSIGTKAFGNCTHLTGISVDGGNSSYKSENDVLFNKTGSELICYPAGKTETSYTILAGVTSIAEEAFAYNTHLTTIPSSSATSFSIGTYAFKNCTSLSSITLTGVASIADYTFNGCNALSTVSITGNGSTTIGAQAFYHLTALTTVTLTNIASIGANAFDGCSSLSSLTINGSTDIGYAAFYGAPLTTTLSLTGVTRIGDHSFEYCGMSSITLPETLTTIGLQAFGICTSLTGINIPASVNTIDESAFLGCSSLGTITVGAGNTHYLASENILFSQDGSGNITGLICYPPTKEETSYTIPTTVTSLGSCAFYGQTNLQKIILHHTSVPVGGTFMFSDTSFNILVKKGMKSNYTSAPFWNSVSSRIYELDLAQATITLSGTGLNGTSPDQYYIYDDSAKEPTITVTLAGFTLTTPSDYTFAYTDNTDVGTATVTITGAGDYAETSGTKTFKIKREIVFGDVNSQYVTYYSAENLVLPPCVWVEQHLYQQCYTAHLVTGVNWETGTVTLSEDLGYIPANKPVILHFPVDGYFRNKTFQLDKYTGAEKDYTSDAFKPSTLFVGTSISKTYDELDDIYSMIYVLRNGRFFRATNGTLAANRCFIGVPIAAPAPSSPGFLPAELIFGDGNGTTGIRDVKLPSDKGRDVYYDLYGRRVLYPTKGGVYIYNGKKIIIK